MLNLHPNIRKRDAEVHFFDDDERFSKGFDWYRKRMPYSFDNQVDNVYIYSDFSTLRNSQKLMLNSYIDSFQILLYLSTSFNVALSKILKLN